MPDDRERLVTPDQALSEAHSVIERLLDYALMHCPELIENEDVGKQSPLVTAAKAALDHLRAQQHDSRERESG